MLFSLILPVYGVENYIAACIESCCQQTGIDCSDYEIIIVNDSSPDRSIDIAKSCLTAFPQVSYKIITRPNGGLSAARNTGLEAASGDYIWFIDSDDWIEPDSLSVLKECIVKYPDAEIISFGHRNNYPGSTIDHRLPECIVGQKSTGISVIEATSFYSACNKIYKSSVLSQEGMRFREGIIWEDAEFNLRLFPLIANHVGIKNILYNYMRRPGSISTSNKVRHTLESDLIRYDSVSEWFESHHLSSHDMKVLNRRNNEAIIFFLAGVPQIEKVDRNIYYAKLKPRRRRILKSFFNSASWLQPLLGIGIVVCPRILSRLLSARMQRILKDEQALYEL